jgi:hypothetical protein
MVLKLTCFTILPHTFDYLFINNKSLSVVEIDNCSLSVNNVFLSGLTQHTPRLTSLTVLTDTHNGSHDLLMDLLKSARCLTVFSYRLQEEGQETENVESIRDAARRWCKYLERLEVVCEK